jgi:ribosomal protein S18 acetylase RimI-like enzyme
MTAPDLEGLGIGGSLLAAIETRTAKDTDCFELSTGAKSSANIERYQRHGYRIVDESIDTAGIRVVNMSKPVVAAQ